MSNLPAAYIAGPMKGRDRLNEPAFRAAMAYVNRLGYRAIIPHDITVREHHGPCPDGYDAAQSDHSGWCYLRSDIAVMAACDVVVLLPGWTDSKGASIEHEIATRLEIPCFPLEQLPAASELFTAAPATETDEPAERLANIMERIILREGIVKSQTQLLKDCRAEGASWSKKPEKDPTKAAIKLLEERGNVQVIKNDNAGGQQPRVSFVAVAEDQA